jgi:RimJ/RimL family protein N-acetyltransferase
MPLSVENLTKFWEQAKEYRTLFNEEIRGDFKKFMDVFLYEDAKGQIQTKGLFWVLDDFAGVYYMTKIIPGVDALCHVNMLDGRFKGREEISKRLLLYAFEKYGFHRLTVQVPVYIKPNVIRFIRNLGFVSEGRLRGLVYYHDKWFDVFSFGIFKDELKLKR